MLRCVALLLLGDALGGPAQHLRINGVEFAWRTFALPEAAAAVLAQPGPDWRAVGSAGAVPGWNVATRRCADQVETLQWRSVAGGAIEGIWSSLDPGKPPAPAVAPPLRLPIGAVVTATYEQLDAEAPVRQFIGSSGLPPRSCASSLRAAAGVAGWVPEHSLRAAAGPEAAEVSWYARRGERLRIHLGANAGGCGFLIEHHLRPGERQSPWP